MAEVPPITQTVGFNFKMVDPEGTAPLRVVAGHAKRLGERWAELGDEMFALADGFDLLVAGTPEPVDGEVAP